MTRHPVALGFSVAIFLAVAGSGAAVAGEAAADGCFFEAEFLESRIAGMTAEARRAAAEKRGAELLAAAEAAGDSGENANDIETEEEALAKAGMCVYPPGYIDTLAQGSMAPSAEERALAGEREDNVLTIDELIARAIADRLYAGGMTALPVPLSSLIEEPAS